MLSNYLKLLTQPETQAFLSAHEHDDEKLLVLKHKEIQGIPSPLIAAQLNGRRKAKAKLPTWYAAKGIVYPLGINMEQCSSEATAIFKTEVVNENATSKKLAVDLTGGFGVDSYFLSKKFKRVNYIEPIEDLLQISKHNHQQLGVSNIGYYCSTAENFVSQTNFVADLIFIDPSRRDGHSKRVYKLADCLPDITKLQASLLDQANFILIKASPLLDIQQGLREIQHVKKVIVVSVNNECKELLFLAEKDFQNEILIQAVDLFENGLVKNAVSFSFADEQTAEIIYSEPGQYLYEPNASIMKSGAFKWIAQKFGLTKLGVNTHLYSSGEVVAGFPGKVFRIESLNPGSSQIKEYLSDGYVNVISRNYPLTTEEIKKKYRLQDGGSLFLVGFSTSKRKHLALCSRVTYT